MQNTNYLVKLLTLYISINLLYNSTNYLDLQSNNFKKDINQEVLNNSEEKIRLVDIENNKKDIKLADMNQ